MKKIMFKISAIVFLTLSLSYAQTSTPSVSLSGYYTGGNYSNQTSSNGFSVFSSIGFTGGDYLIAGFDQLKISHKEWKYDQKMFTGGVIKNMYPFYLKANYAHVEGTYDYKPFQYTYDDVLNIYNVNMLYNYNLFYFGAGFTYQDLNGLISVVSKQIKTNISWLVTTKLTLSVFGLYSTVSDDRNLNSFYGEAAYSPAKNIKITVGGMAGKRAYYFDENLLTIFNQHETQTAHYKAKLEIKIGKQVKIPLVFQYADFDDFSIFYYTAGLIISF